MTTKNIQKPVNYISFEEFVELSGVKEETVKRNYKKIPGVTKNDYGYQVLSGSRYPFDAHRYKLDTYTKKRYVLLKAINHYKYIDHRILKLEKRQFDDMLKELLSASLIKENHLSNAFGANSYDLTAKGEVYMLQTQAKAIKEIVNVVAASAGTFTGAVISQVYDFAS